ncbi:MAG: response regulator transcription factor [Helicobacteraceae bacterium]|jgi:two-component system OmpR family response regulator|nr:response regulator transcription factor [Helicobacteraceae bacterium]
MKILLLEDEYSLRISIKEFLEELDFEVDCFSNGDDAYDAVYSVHYDVLLLDVNVPGMNGFELLKSIRDDGVKIPAIFMTSLTQMRDFEEGYKAGCCDYIRKPFDLMELQLRIAQVCKSFYFKNSELLELGEGLVYDTAKSQLSYKGEEIVLSKTEHDILEVLLRYKEQTVSITIFQDEIWGEYVDPANIRVQINNLRKKLPVDIIKNRRGVGYIIER